MSDSDCVLVPSALPLYLRKACFSGAENVWRLCRSICGKAVLFRKWPYRLAATPPLGGLAAKNYKLAGKAELFRK